MTTKILIEWHVRTEDGQRAWQRVRVPLTYTKNRNQIAKHDEQVYVWKSLSERTPVVSLIDGKWVEVGRISHFTVFLGGKNEQSYESGCVPLKARQCGKKL